MDKHWRKEKSQVKGHQLEAHWMCLKYLGWSELEWSQKVQWDLWGGRNLSPCKDCQCTESKKELHADPYMGTGFIRKATSCMEKRPGLSHVILACIKSQPDMEAMGSRCRTILKVEWMRLSMTELRAPKKEVSGRNPRSLILATCSGRL